MGCIHTTSNDMEAQIARMCEAVEWIECEAHDGCGHGVTLACVRGKGHDGSHRDVGGLEWRLT
jgi:hypothetical protein